MAIKRYYATKDNTITNAFKSDLSSRATASNMGLADVLETFSIYGQASASSGLSSELSRILIEFDTDAISTDRTSGTIPGSGSVSFYLRMFNAKHGQTLPRNYVLQAKAVLSSSWEEGYGLDMEDYGDSTRDAVGSNWVNAKEGTQWLNTGGDYANPENDFTSSFTQTFSSGHEDLEMDITTLVEQWISSSANDPTAINLGSKSNFGIGLMFSSSHESESRSFYTKKFFARSSQFFFKRPVLEARWDSRKLDNRGNFIYSSSLATGDENLNQIWLYNYFRGQLRDIPEVGTGNIYVSFFSGSDDSSPTGPALELVVDGTHVSAAGLNRVVTGSHHSTGIYSASVALTAAGTPLDTIYDVWFTGGDLPTSTGATRYHTGSIVPAMVDSSNINPSGKFSSKITNLKSIYSSDEKARFRVYIRNRDWQPTIYTVANTNVETTEIDSGSYKVFRIIDELNAVPFGTGSDLHTCMSYDVSGNYFDLDMSLLEPGYMYGIKLAYYNGSVGAWLEQPETFKFRVE